MGHHWCHPIHQKYNIKPYLVTKWWSWYHKYSVAAIKVFVSSNIYIDGSNIANWYWTFVSLPLLVWSCLNWDLASWFNRTEMNKMPPTGTFSTSWLNKIVWIHENTIPPADQCNTILMEVKQPVLPESEQKGPLCKTKKEW